MANHTEHGAHSKGPHVLPLSVYLWVISALLVLTVITVWVASYDLGPANLVVAMLVAAVKGTLVALYFMHLRYDNKLYALIFGSALFFLAIFIIITMFDTLRRDDIYEFRAAPVEEKAVIYNSTDQAAPASDAAVTDSSTAEQSASDSTLAGH